GVRRDAAGEQPRDAAVLEDDLGGSDVLVWAAVEAAAHGRHLDDVARNEAEDYVYVVDHQVEDHADVLDARGCDQAAGLAQVRLLHLRPELLDRAVEPRDVTHLPSDRLG